MTVAIKFENISKQYRLGIVSTNALMHDMNRWWQMNIKGKEDPYLKIGDVNDRSTKADSDYVWALRNIDFEVQQGDVLGIIGKNGAGKSTLLKILSRVTTPTTGSIKAKGRIASLLEVGTGFHPELTGRENIYMNGAILGMSKPEIKQKLDEIIDFSGCERYIDTPTKRYSSGMTVRLGFAIAAHLDPEILVVDEVLAVGDAEFQKKAIGKMQDVSKGEGRTVLFVSHNMTAVKNLCKTGLILKNGTVDFSGDIESAVNYYLSNSNDLVSENNYWSFENAPGNDSVKIKSTYISVQSKVLFVDTAFDICTEFWCLEDMELNINLFLYDNNQTCIFSLPSKQTTVKKGKSYKMTFCIPENLMNDGLIKAEFMYVANNNPFFIHRDALVIEVFENRKSYGYYGKWIGIIRPTEIRRDLVEIKD